MTQRVSVCDALVAVIGADWVSSVDRNNRRRIDNPHDFVRIEIEAALDCGVRVIPVLVDGATMPVPEDLPESLRKLVRLQGIEISHTRFDADVRRLTRTLRLFEDQLRQREAAEAEAARSAEEERRAKETANAERAAHEERERQKAVEAARVEEAGRLAETAATRRMQEERRAREAAQAEAERKAEEGRREQEAVKFEHQREVAEERATHPTTLGTLSANELRQREEAERLQLRRAELEVRAEVRGRSKAQATGLRQEGRRAWESERAVREEREKREVATEARMIEEHRSGEVPQARSDPSEAATNTKTEAAGSVAANATPNELYQMGNNYLYGVGGKPDAEQAVSCYRKAADQGNAEAQFRLGELYEAGLGVVAHFGQMEARYQMAANQGHSRAQLRLGELYEVESRVDMDRDRAKMWYQKAADQGELRAQAALMRLQGK